MTIISWRIVSLFIQQIVLMFHCGSINSDGIHDRFIGAGTDYKYICLNSSLRTNLLNYSAKNSSIATFTFIAVNAYCDSLFIDTAYISTGSIHFSLDQISGKRNEDEISEEIVTNSFMEPTRQVLIRRGDSILINLPLEKAFYRANGIDNTLLIIGEYILCAAIDFDTVATCKFYVK